MKKKNHSFATKEDIEELAGMTNRALEKELRPIHEHLEVIEADVAELKVDVKEIRGGIQSLLKVMQGIDEQLREHRDLPERIARLERSVFQ